MRKWLVLEIIALVLLIAVAVVAYLDATVGIFPEPDFGVENPTTEATTEATTQATTEPVTEPTTEATEPFVMPPITWATYPEERELTATKAFVYDLQKEEYTYLLGDPREQLWPASITKLFAIHVALQYLDPQWQLTAGSILERIPEDASTAKLEDGDVMTVEMLVQGMLMPSGNDAAYMIATEAGREIAGNPDLDIDAAVETFVLEMNRQAEVLGMTGTRYENPDGYHSEGHYTNFDDLVTVAKLVLENETIMKYAAIPKAAVQPVVGSDKDWINTNLLVNPETDYYCPYAIGLKTGQTDAAGSCLLSAFDIEGHKYIIGVFGSPLFNDKLDDTLQILNTYVMMTE